MGGTEGVGWVIVYEKSLEIVAERILWEMKIENHGTKYFPWGKNQEAYLFFFSMKIKMMYL